MSYRIIVEPKAHAHALAHREAGRKNLLKKINDLYEELENHPETGTGKPEKLKYREVETWSRRLLGKHRMEYTIDEDKLEVHIICLLGHYGDK